MVSWHVICIQLQPGGPNAPFSFSLLLRITKGKISCFVFFCLCLLFLPSLGSGLLWEKFSKRSPSAVHLKVQRLKKNGGPSQSTLILPYQPEVPPETQGSSHPLQPRLQWWASNWSSCLLSSGMPPSKCPSKTSYVKCMVTKALAVPHKLLKNKTRNSYLGCSPSTSGHNLSFHRLHSSNLSSWS